MARLAPPDYGVTDSTVWCEECEPEEPIPGWRTPIALAGWGALIAILIALIVWGIIQLSRGAPPQEPTITLTTPPVPPSSAPPVAPPTQTLQQKTPTSTEIPAPSTTDADTIPPLTSTSSSPAALPLPQLPSVITLPAVPGLPGMPTEITLPPGL